MGFPPEFRVPGSDPKIVGKITIFPGGKTLRKNPEITQKYPELEARNFRVLTRNSEIFPSFTFNSEILLGSTDSENVRSLSRTGFILLFKFIIQI